MPVPRNIFITGRPGIGKTTAIVKVIELLDLPVHGFTTAEIREGRKRVGFEIKDMQGNAAVMAHVDFPGPIRVGKYGVDTGAVEAVGAEALRRALERRTPAVVDEVGKMELACPAFVDALLAAVAADIPVLGTMHLRADEATRSIRAREDTQIMEITRANRNELPRRLADLLKQAAGVATDPS